ncbi:MAG: alkaline phosphatase family protein, partial [Planctomycetota bacterium]
MRVLAFLALCATLARAGPPRLAVVVVVDQLRPDTLARFRGEYRGGLKRVLESGRGFPCAHDHAATETAPGHATLLTGCHPRSHGITQNGWLDAAGLRQVYCVEDERSPVFGARGEGRSPRLLLRPGLGDWMKAADPRSRVVAVAGKDRAALLMGAFHADAAFWFHPEAGGMTSSGYYFPAGLPDWVAAFHADGWVDALPEEWSYAPDPSLGPDDDPRESPLFGRASPHPLRRGDRRRFLEAFVGSPYLDELTLRFARRLVERYDLGGDGSPDLLCVSCSSTDTVGHLYGPASQEVRDTVLRLDARLGELFDLLDARGHRWIVALSADHGVLPLAQLRRAPLQE